MNEGKLKTVDIAPTWEGLMPLYLEVLVEQGAHCQLRSEFMRMAKAADLWNDLQRANRAAVEKVMS